MPTERKNITQPADWWLKFDSEARKAGMTLSEWVGQCCRKALSKTENKLLSERPPAHRPKGTTDELTGNS